MSEEPTTLVVQRYLDAHGEGADQEAALRGLLDRAVRRLRILCGGLLRRQYPRLTRAPLYLDKEELLGAVVERLIQALREVKPGTVRQFFFLANRHIRWELNELARRLDESPPAAALPESLPAPAPSDSNLSPLSRRLIDEIDRLPDEEREVFELVRLQGLTHAETSELLGVSTKTVQRRLNRGLVLLAQRLQDVRP